MSRRLLIDIDSKYSAKPEFRSVEISIINSLVELVKNVRIANYKLNDNINGNHHIMYDEPGDMETTKRSTFSGK